MAADQPQPAADSGEVGAVPPAATESARDRIIALAKQVQNEQRYGTISDGNVRYPNPVPVSPFVVLGLLMAVEVLDA